MHYVPGWDCHGLPIELKALSSAKKKVSDLTPLQIRSQGTDFFIVIYNCSLYVCVTYTL